jgi:uncharacterized protein
MMRTQQVGRRRNWRKLLVIWLAFAFFGFNAVAFMQARSMTHYVPSGQRTPPPEQLSFLAKTWTILTGTTVPRPQNDHTPADVELPYETQEIIISESEFLEAWHIAAIGSQGIVLLFPGYAESKESLLPAALVFHEAGYDTMLVDFRGTGGSSGSDTTLGVREAEDVAYSLAYAKRIWPGRPIVLYGVSMGAAAVLRAIATEAIQPDAVILESPFDSLLGTVGNRFNAMGLPAFPSAELLVFWGSVQQGFNGFTHNPADYARSVTCPTLLLHGDQDPRVTVEQNDAIFQNLAGPKQLVSFPGAGHETLVVDAPEAWEQYVTKFVHESIGKD